MERNYSKAGWGRSLGIIISIFLLIVLGLIQSYASEQVVKHANINALVKNKLIHEQ